MKYLKTIVALSLVGTLILSGCTRENTQGNTFVFGTTAYSLSNANAGLNPHSDYSGWSTVRYGVGETLFKYNENMEPEPWLASGFDMVDANTWQVTLNEDVYFSSGRLMDATAVKQCIEHLISVHDRAPYDLKIESIEAQDFTLTFKTTQPVPAFINYLSDPYGAIIDMDYGVTEDANVAGTGPFVASEVSSSEITLQKNHNYWGGEVLTDTIVVKSIPDSDAMTFSLQSGELDAVQGLAYASIPLFENNDDYTISTAQTSRAFFTQTNTHSAIMQDEALRKAIAMGIDKESFNSLLLNGNGSVATTPFPTDSFTSTVDVVEYDVQAAKQLLAEAGYIDTDGDGYVEKNGETVVLRWLTYPSRHELPLLAEMAQSDLKQLGLKLEINATVNYNDFLSSGDWDIYASAFVTMPTGDYEYFFSTHTLQNSSKNRGNYYSEEMERLNSELSVTFDAASRQDIALKMAQLLADSHHFIFVSHLNMSIVMQDTVSGFSAHPSDYYEISSQLRVEPI